MLWIILVVAFGLLAATYGFHRWQMKRWNDSAQRQFSESFPGRCRVCWYHQYGVDHGFEQLDSSPRPHHCIEAARLRAALKLVPPHNQDTE